MKSHSLWLRTELNSGRSPNIVTKSLTAVSLTFTMLWLPGECLWRSEQEQHPWVTTREGQNQLHQQPVLRVTQYFWGSGLPWKGFRPASRSWAHTNPCVVPEQQETSTSDPHPRAEWGRGRTLTDPITEEENPPKKVFLIQLTISK